MPITGARFEMPPFFEYRLALCKALFALVGTLALGFLFGHSIDRWIWDRVSNLQFGGTYDARVVLVDLDERSLSRFGPWPWSRTQISNLFEKINTGGPSLIVFDGYFPQSKLGDQSLGTVLRSSNIVVGQLFFQTNPASQVRLGELSRLKPIADQQCPDGILTFNSFLGNSKSLGPVIAGNIAAVIDDDGIVRRIPLVVCHDQKLFPALAFAAFSRLIDETVPAPDGRWQLGREVNRGPLQNLLAPELWLSGGLTLGLDIPLASDGTLLIPPQIGGLRVERISAGEIIDGVKHFDLADRVVFVGSTAQGVGDAIALSSKRLNYGVEVHLHLFLSILDRLFVYEPRNKRWMLFCYGIAYFLLVVFWARMDTRRVFVASLMFVLGGLTSATYLVLKVGLWIHSYFLWLLPLVTFLLHLFLKSHDLERIRQDLERQLKFFGAENYGFVFRRLWKNRSAQRFGGSLAADVIGDQFTAAVLMIDIQNSSKLARILGPDGELEFFNFFYSNLASVAERFGGQVNQYMGDGASIIFPQGGDFAGNEQHAVVRGIHAYRKLSELMAVADKSIARANIRAGLDFGVVSSGVFGNAKRGAFTTMGDALIRARRLETLAKQLARPLLLSENAAREAEDFLRGLLKESGRYRLRGFEFEESVFEIDFRDIQDASEHG